LSGSPPVKTKTGTWRVVVVFALGVGELIGVGDGLGGGAAVFAGQVAALGHLPDGEERGFVVVDGAARGDGMHGLKRLHEASWEPGWAGSENS